MKEYIYCKSFEKGKQSFYVVAGGDEYYLFSQDFRRSNKEVFRNKVFLDELRKLKKHHSHSVRITVEKIPSHIRYIEKEYGINLLNKSKESRRNNYTYLKSINENFESVFDYA